MFQSFEDKSDPSAGPRRLAALRAEMDKERLAGFIVPRADAHQGEYVAPCDERLSWLTGFTGSAGFAVVLRNEAGVFIDGRYTEQVRGQVDLESFTPVPWPTNKIGPWLSDRIDDDDKIGFDPWLHTRFEINAAAKVLGEDVLRPCPNLVDRIWSDRPAKPSEPAISYPDELAGVPSAEKLQALSKTLRNAGQRAAVITLPDSIAWALNIRGNDIERIPVVQAFAILHDDGQMELFTDPAKVARIGLSARPWEEFEYALSELVGPVRVDPKSAPVAIWEVLESSGVETAEGEDPCILPKACKSTAEIEGARTSHIRDAAAMVEFLAWLDQEAPSGSLTEIDVVKALEGFRRATNALRDISFETISGSGPNGAIVHYRVTERSNRTVKPGELLLVDSGGQYLEGTTDITRTIAIGDAGAEEKRSFTLVLKGMIAVSRVRFPVGLAGRDLDALARNALWAEGLDYDHGTGHGVGAYLSVHEGPQRISRISHEVLKPGMILSNEPGYYKPGAYGIRIENLIVVRTAAPIDGGDNRAMLDFETLTWVPIDRNLIDCSLLSGAERDWINSYHAAVSAKLEGALSETASEWLAKATAPI